MFVLVGYASEHGSTHSIAQYVATTLTAYGNRVELLPLDQVQDVGRYDAVVLGSAVHSRAWLPVAAQFLRRHVEALAARPVWLFSVGLPAALPGPLRRFDKQEERKLTEGFPDGLHARDHRLFSGVFERGHVPLVGRLVFRAIGGRYGDFRDWAEIRSWADGIGGALAVASPDHTVMEG